MNNNAMNNNAMNNVYNNIVNNNVVNNNSKNSNNAFKTNMMNNSQNCVNFNSGEFKLQGLSGLKEDQCFLRERMKQSVGTGNYMLSNFHACDCNVNDVINTATQNPAITFRDGYGISECNVNNDSALRVGRTKKFPKCPDQLFERPIGSIPFMGRGSGNSEIEYQIIQGDQTRDKRECNVLSGVTIENYFDPLIESVESTIQNPENLIEEAADSKWIRGGTPTRQIVKDIDYLQRCSDSLENKAVVLNRKGYLQK